MAAEVSYLVAAAGGAVSFLSPCVLPLVPAYLCFMAGTSLEQLTDGAQVDRARSRKVLLASLFFVLGFTTVFTALGATASAMSRLLLDHIDLLSKGAGALIVVFGLHYMGLFRIGFLNREMRFNPDRIGGGVVGPFVIGLAFAFGWTPCIGPILATVLTIAASDERLSHGISLLLVYSLGLGIPFVAAAAAINPFLRFMRRFRRHMRKVEFGAGLALAATGILVFTGGLSQFGFYILEVFPALGRIG
ncbi:MAG: cytochrome c biogenesis protein CcdA [Alphaproteobacteria bacterium]|nr:cytochrome c biogenesis protein CcdA [Alphaproteobacteria bacterium]